jgi:1,4-alpha-glucan branching enzyme
MIINDFLEGLSLNAYEYFGAHFIDGGVRFATYAPHARNVT